MDAGVHSGRAWRCDKVGNGAADAVGVLRRGSCNGVIGCRWHLLIEQGGVS